MKKRKSKKTHTREISLVLLAAAVAGTMFWASRRESPVAGSKGGAKTLDSLTSSPATPGTGKAAIPPYFDSAEEAKPFPKLLPATYFSNTPLVARAYRAAALIPEVVAQQPCYCFCDRYGHRSLLDCYASNHAAG